MYYMFPTFPMRSSEFDVSKILGLKPIYEKYKKRAENCIPLNLGILEGATNSSLANFEAAEQAHYACITENVTMAEWVSKNIAKCDHAVTYSHGTFSALVHLEALDFESVLKLIQAIFNQALKPYSQTPWALGAVVGLSAENLKGLFLKVDKDLEITDFYGPHAILFSGLAGSVKKVLDLAIEQGSPLTRLVPLCAPFHTSKLLEITPIMDKLLQSFQFKAPTVPLFSSVTHEWLTTADELRSEICNNISSPLNLNLTFEKISECKPSTLIECGSSFSLTDIVRPMLPKEWKCLDFRDLRPNEAKIHEAK